jgi:hypothetical protein
VVVVAGCGGGRTGSGAPTTTTTTLSTAATISTTSTVRTTAATTTAAPTTTAGSIARTAECRSADLRLSLAPTEGTAGTFYTAVRLTNASPRNCFVVGFPGVSYVDSKGRQVGAAAERIGAIGSKVTLRPGGTASAVLGMVDIGVFDPGTCRPTPVAGLRVYPPDETAAMYVAYPTTGCAGLTSPPQLHVNTIVPSMTGM